MTEAQRLARNEAMLKECYPVFAARGLRIEERLAVDKRRPRYQDAFRTLERQAAAKAGGVSRLAKGFHNMTTPTGLPAALALDVVDDDDPVWPNNWQALEGPDRDRRRRFVFALARAARLEGCRTGITWGLTVEDRLFIEQAILGQRPPEGVMVGWDPLHIEPADLTIAEALAGARPKPMAPVPPAPDPSGSPTNPAEAAAAGRVSSTGSHVAATGPADPTLADRVRATRSLPTIWTTRGPDGSMTQLDGDVRHWLARQAAGYDWTRYVTEFGTVAGRIRRLYPVWLTYAPAQLLRDFMAEQGITSQAEALPKFERAHGDLQQLIRAKWVEFIGTWEVTAQ